MEASVGRGPGEGTPWESVLVPDPAGLGSADLSPWFNPFLGHFVRETLRAGGRVACIRHDAAIVGLTLEDPAENLLSIFTRAPGLAWDRLRSRGVAAAYADHRFEGPAEVFGIYRGRVEQEDRPPPFRHRVRPVREADLPGVAELLREVQGAADDRWFQGLLATPEAGFLIEVGDRIAGVAWVAVVGRHARLHSLAVRPIFRHLGLGHDLLEARLLWARRAGATEVLSEIADRNAASRAVAEAAGLHWAGEIYLYPPLGESPRS